MSDVLASKRTYPWRTNLKGKEFTFRIFERKDRDAVLKFARELPKEDLLFLTIDITDSDELDQWVKETENNRSKTILVETDGQIVGYGHLVYNQVQWTHHLGDIRLLVSTKYRGYRLGKTLVNEVFLLAHEMGLQKLTSQMTSDRKGAMQIFEHLGFKAEALLTDYVIDRDGRTHDLVVMSYDVKGFTE